MAETNAEFGEIAATLDTCTTRLGEIRQELELIAILVSMASVSLRRHAGGTPAETDIRRRLEQHRDRLAEAIGAAAAAPAADKGWESIKPNPPATGHSDPPDGKFPFRMDPVGRTIRIGRRRVPLTGSEFQIVEQLWEQMPAPVSRQRLLEHLYAGREAPTDAVLDMFVFRIRQKLKNAGCVDAAITSVRGLGWMLELGERHSGVDERDIELGAQDI